MQRNAPPEIGIGTRFGLLVVCGPRTVRGTGRRSCSFWPVRCDCGTEKEVNAKCLRSGETKSCGCNRGAHLIALCTKHGHRLDGKPSPEYVTWMAMKARCHNQRAANFKWYGARGISVCERWRESFEDFLADMGPKPSRRHTIERVDVSGNYEPGNCRWATWAEQHQNTTTTAWIEIGGVRRTRGEWAALAGIRPQTLANRQRLGWTGERLILPLQQEGRRAKGQ